MHIEPVQRLITAAQLGSLGVAVLEIFAPYGHGPDRPLTADELANLAEIVASEVADLWPEIPADLFPGAAAVGASWTALGESRTTGEVWEAHLAFQRALLELTAAPASPDDRGPSPDHWSCVVDYGRQPRRYGVRCGVRHRSEAAAVRHWVRLAVADYDPRFFGAKHTADDALVEPHAAERMEWKVVRRRRWGPYRWWRRSHEWHSTDGRWIVRLVKIDKWRRRWKVYDCRRRSYLSLDWDDALSGSNDARLFAEGYGRTHRLCCCPATPIDRERIRQARLPAAEGDTQNG